MASSKRNHISSLYFYEIKKQLQGNFEVICRKAAIVGSVKEKMHNKNYKVKVTSGVQ